MSPKTIGIAGPSSSGKTTLANMLQRSHPGAAILCIDDFYKDKIDCPKCPEGYENWDVPESLHMADFKECVSRLRQGQETQVPVYSIQEERRVGYKMVTPGELVVVEGFLIYPSDEFAALFDTRVFLDVDVLNQKQRRIQRNIDYIPNYFETVVVPTFTQYGPYMRSVAHEVIDGNKTPERVVEELKNALTKYQL